MKKLIPITISLLFFVFFAEAQCPANKAKIKVVLLTDNYPNESSWKIYNSANIVVKQSPPTLTANTLYQDSVCIDTGACYIFKMFDSYGDGICCANGHGYFKVFYNGVLVKSDSNFGSLSSVSFACPPGNDCSSAFAVTTGSYTTPFVNAWYQFTPTATGIYNVKTCALANSCNTKLWLYDYCANLQPDSTNVSTIYYADDNCDTTHESVNAYFVAGHAYYIKVGTVMGSCNSTPIHWSITQNTAISGCLDTPACNFNPFATISVPSSCIYYPSSLCPTGPDLQVDSAKLSTTITATTMVSNDACSIHEGCVNGYGTREIIRFSTHINNIGATDFYAGPPPSNPNAYSSIFHYDVCHGHWHFTDYAEYLLADSLNNFVPIGYKNGFCVLDLMCYTGSAKFGCNNMGITSGCADEYSSGLQCQWIDVTDVPDGNYKLIVRANWQPRPDFYGRYEVSYFNNWARACIHIYHNASNVRSVTVTPNCAPYYDCLGVQNGLAVKDCNGDCNGKRLTGDLNLDTMRNNIDVTNYLIGSIYHTIPASKCFDLNNDGKINVIDAALLYDCSAHGAGGATPAGHTHQPCVFPNTVKNPTQQAAFSLGNVDTLHKTIDIMLLDTNSKILGYQLKISGIHLNNAQNLISIFSPEIYTKPSGEIIALSHNEVPIPKNLTTVPLMRLSYISIDSSKICLQVVAAINESFEELSQAVVIDSICVTATPTPTGIAMFSQDVRHALYPNPFSNTSTLSINNPWKDNYDVTLTDIMGRVIRQYGTRNDNAINIERGSLAPGIYYLNVRSEKWRFVEKMIVE